MKTFLALLLGAAFCFAWPVFLATVCLPFGVFVGLFLWPIGVLPLGRAFRFETDPSFEPPEPPTSFKVAVGRTDDVYGDNYRAVLSWIESTSPGWPRSSQHRFAESLASSFGTRRWSGNNLDPIFAEATDRYMEQYWAAPPLRIALSEIQSEEQLGHFALKQRFRQAPTTSFTKPYRATDGVVEVGLVVLDLLPERDDVELYEFFVSPPRQRQGYGTAILQAVEDLAWELRRPRVLVWSRQIDPTGMSDSQLARWYARRGYSPVTSDSERLSKELR